MSAAEGPCLIGTSLTPTWWTSVTAGFPSTTSTLVDGLYCSSLVLQLSADVCSRNISSGEYAATSCRSAPDDDAAALAAKTSEADATMPRNAANHPGRRITKPT